MNKRLMTFIELPYDAMKVVSEILEEAGFTDGASGTIYVQMEREGTIQEQEEAELKKKMSDALFEFETYDLDEEDEDWDD